MMTDARTRLFALLGDPVSHSRSPAMQGAAFSAAGMNAVYVALRCTKQDVPQLIRALSRAGGGGNVTIPHKETALAGIDVPSAAVTATGACNTFWFQDGCVHGDNTDVTGFTTAAKGLVGELNGCAALVLGAGGAARAVVHALLAGGAHRVTITNRDPERARSLAAQLDPGGTRVHVEPDRTHRGAGFDLIVNATSLGLDDDDPLPLVLPALARTGAVLDLVYRAGGTPLVHQAAALGIPARDGFDMLLAQGAAAFECWFRRPAPVDVMRDALLEAQ